MSEAIRAGDWVSNHGYIGIVRRVAKDGRWADVDWGPHSKRMPAGSLKVEHTIPLGGMTVTDVMRQRELEAETK